MTPLLHTIPEACDQLRVGRSTLYQLIATGQLRTVKLGKRRLVPAEALAELVDRLESNAA